MFRISCLDCVLCGNDKVETNYLFHLLSMHFNKMQRKSDFSCNGVWSKQRKHEHLRSYIHKWRSAKTYSPRSTNKYDLTWILYKHICFSVFASYKHVILKTYYPQSEIIAQIHLSSVRSRSKILVMIWYAWK